MKERNSKLDVVLIIDFGSQYTHLIGRRIRELGVYSEVLPYDFSSAEFGRLTELYRIKGFILSGGPSSVYAEGSPRCDDIIFRYNVPILGICYGHQLLAYLHGGKVVPGRKMEYGVAKVRLIKRDLLFSGLENEHIVWMSHMDIVEELPDELEILASTEHCPIAAFKHKTKPIYGIQWHPEVRHTEKGLKLLENFVFKICKCELSWKLSDFISRAVSEIKEKVGNSKAVIALSGGIDSTTAAVLASKAIGKNLTAILVDHGLLRSGEVEQIVKTLRGIGINLRAIDAKKKFLEALRGITDPEQKRKIIGELFIRTFEREAEKIGAEYLIQGTIYPDRIESGFRRGSDKIKTHHNVGGLPIRIKFKGIVEPLRDLYKDEVRKVARQLGLPDSIVYRQPFPGPGLAVRILGEVTEEKIEILRKADQIVREEFERSGLHKVLWQYFAVLLDLKTTGIKGDARAYGYIVAIRAVESEDAMTANFAKVSYELLERISSRITNEVKEVVRVVYDITHKPPSTIEWE